MLRTVDLRCLRQDRAAAVAHQQIDRGAERRIRADAGIAIRAAALQAENQMRPRHRLALYLVRFRQHLLHTCDAVLYRLPRAALLLDGEGTKLVALLQTLRCHEHVDLVRLAAKPDDLRRVEVRMPRVAGDRAAEQVGRFALRRHAAPRLMRQRDDAVHVRIIVQPVLEVLGDHARDGRRAVHARQDADVVARGDTSIGALDAHEGRRRLDVLRELDTGAEGVIALKVAHGDVMHVDVVAGRDRLRGEADDLVIAMHRFALRHGAHGDLVPRRDAHRCAHVFLLRQGGDNPPECPDRSPGCPRAARYGR